MQSSYLSCQQIDHTSQHLTTIVSWHVSETSKTDTRRIWIHCMSTTKDKINFCQMPGIQGLCDVSLLKSSLLEYFLNDYSDACENFERGKSWRDQFLRDMFDWCHKLDVGSDPHRRNDRSESISIRISKILALTREGTRIFLPQIHTWFDAEHITIFRLLGSEQPRDWTLDEVSF